MIVTGASAQSMGPPALFGYVARIDLGSSLADCLSVSFRFLDLYRSQKTVATNEYQNKNQLTSGINYFFNSPILPLSHHTAQEGSILGKIYQ